MMKRYLFLVFLLCHALLSFSVSKNHLLKKDISYSDHQDAYSKERCKLDVYYPSDTVDCPVVVWFHGGGLTGGNKKIPEELKNGGMVVVAVNYRLIPKVGIGQCIDDAAQAVAWVFHHVLDYGGSPRKIYVSGHSAGGYLTYMVGLDRKWLRKYGVEADSIAALLPLSGQVITHFAHRNLQGISPYRATIDEYAPLTYTRPDPPAMLVISGDRELELYGRYEEQAYFWRMMKLCGHEKTWLYEMQGFTHGEMVLPGLQLVKKYIQTMEKGDNWK